MTDPRLYDARTPTDNSVDANKLVDGSVTSGKLAALAVVAGKLAPGAINASNLFGTGVVDSTAILDGTILNIDINAAAGIVGTKLANATITDTQIAAANKDGAAGTPSMRTLSTTSTTACAGNDARLSDTRTPSAASITQAMFTTGYRATYEATSAPASPSAGDFWYDTTNKIVSVYNGTVWIQITPESAMVFATENTTTTVAFVDLATAGPSVTLNTGTTAIVAISSSSANNTANNGCKIGVAVSGATTIAAAAMSMTSQSLPSGANEQTPLSVTFPITGLTAGTNTFKMQYAAVSGGTATFFQRGISVTAVPT